MNILNIQLPQPPKILQIFLLALLCSLSAYWIFAPQLRAQLSIVDDHEFAYFLGSQGSIAWSDIPQILAQKTEIGKFGTFPRFRPVYYFLRILEAKWTGLDGTQYHLHRLLIWGTSLFLLTLFFSSFLGLIIGFSFSLYLFQDSYWPDIFNRLGPGETLATLGLALFLASLVKIVAQTKQAAIPSTLPTPILATVINHLKKISPLQAIDFYGLCAALGAWLCLGSKENFLPLTAVYALLFLWQVYYRPPSILQHVLLLITIALTCWVASAIVLSLIHNGQDVYHRSVSTHSLRSVVWESFKHPLFLKITITSVIFYLLIFKLVRKNLIIIQHTTRQKLVYLFLLTLFFGLVVLSQVIFYQGQWPVGNRYDFPGRWMLKFTHFFMAYSLIIIFQDERFRFRKYQNWLIGALFLWTMAQNVKNRFAFLREGAELTQKNTQDFHNKLAHFVALAKSQPSAQLLIKVLNVWDYEFVFSLQRYLAAYQISNPIFLSISAPSNFPADSLEKQLIDELTLISKNGKDSFLPFSDFQNQQTCINITLTYPDSINSCGQSTIF